MKYTLSSFQNTGQDKNGNSKLSATFNDENGNTQNNVYWAVKNPPTIGQQYDGTIEQGQYGPRFKRTFDQQQGVGSAYPAATTYGSKSNNDGQRQGMCINNASAYITATGTELLPPESFAEQVKIYAQELYKIDLTADTVATDVPSDQAGIKELFDNLPV